MISELYKLHYQSVKATNKYFIDWQVARFCMKGLKTDEKIPFLKSYFLIDRNVLKFYRILNYIQACNISKSIEGNTEIEAFLNWCQSNISTEEKEVEVGFKKYNKKQLSKLYKELTGRNDKWVKGGYFHAQQIAFLKDLAHYLGIEYEQAVTENFDYKFKF